MAPSPVRIPERTIDNKPSHIGKYRIMELIGEGAMGVVYRAEDSVLDRTVAIKVMSASIARQEDLRKRFLREGEAAGSLQHPNVVAVYDLGEVDGHLFIAMEFAHGVDLERLIELQEPLTLQAKLDIIADVLAGLSYAHDRGIVHRDIKPDNIRVGNDGRAKIMDFGIAHLASSTMTRTGVVLGTPSYMSPEQVRGAKSTAATDVFAVGAVLYQMLTGNKPFDAPTLQGLFHMIVSEMPRPIAETCPDLPPTLQRIVTKALAKDPNARFINARDMANELSLVQARLNGVPDPASLALGKTFATATGTSTPIPVAGTRNYRFMGAAAAAAIATSLIVWFAFSRASSTASGSKPPGVSLARPAAAVTAPTN